MERINYILSKNENVNVLYKKKYTIFGIDKYINKIGNHKNTYNVIIEKKIQIIIYLKNTQFKKEKNCRYNPL